MEGAAKVVRDHPSREGGEAVAVCPPALGRNTGEEPGENLPVAPDPSMRPTGVGERMPGEILEKDEIGDESGLPVRPLEEVVAEKGVLRGASLETRLEGLDVVDSLPREDPHIEEILIDVEGGPRIEIEPLNSAKDSGENGTSVGVGNDLDARLKDRVAAQDPAPFPDFGAIQGVGERAHQTGGGPARKAGVGVEGEDEGGALEARAIALGDP